MAVAIFNHGISCRLAVMLTATSFAFGDSKQPPNVQRLVEESTKKKAVAESGLLNKNPLTADDISAALDYINNNNDYTAYHLLLAAKKYYPKTYNVISNENKSAILCSALQHTYFLNDWGSFDPFDSHDGNSAKAMLDTGKHALKFLIPLLENNESAPLFGSEEATASKKFVYRRKDFAYRYVMLILGERPTFHADPKERDKGIETLKAKLKKDTK